MENTPTIALFTRYPQAGSAKTRLIPALGETGAADLHRCLVERTLGAVRASGLPFEVWTTGGSAAQFADWLGDDVTLIEQGEGDLGARLAQVAAPAILLGADIPDISPAHLCSAAQALASADAVIGPAADGGYYLLALRAPAPFLFVDMEWGSDRVLAETQRRLVAAGMTCHHLETLHDCDRPEDLARWPELAR